MAWLQLRPTQENEKEGKTDMNKSINNFYSKQFVNKDTGIGSDNYVQFNGKSLVRNLP